MAMSVDQQNVGKTATVNIVFRTLRIPTFQCSRFHIIPFKQNKRFSHSPKQLDVPKKKKKKTQVKKQHQTYVQSHITQEKIYCSTNDTYEHNTIKYFSVKDMRGLNCSHPASKSVNSKHYKGWHGRLFIGNGLGSRKMYVAVCLSC